MNFYFYFLTIKCFLLFLPCFLSCVLASFPPFSVSSRGENQDVTFLMSCPDAVTSLLPSAAVAAGTAPPPLLLVPPSVFLYHIWRRGGGARRHVGIRLAQSHGISYHRTAVIRGAELSPRDGHLTVRVFEGDVDVWWHRWLINQKGVQSEHRRQSRWKSSVEMRQRKLHLVSVTNFFLLWYSKEMK